MTGYPLDRLRQEVAYIAYHFHWPADQILAMEHRDRLSWVAEVARINEHLQSLVGREG
jgi:hypothetical protein